MNCGNLMREQLQPFPQPRHEWEASHSAITALTTCCYYSECYGSDACVVRGTATGAQLPQDQVNQFWTESAKRR